jgi:hypothetical protein
MHVLIAAVLGGLISGVLAAAITVVLYRRRPRLDDVLLAVLGGVVAGGIMAGTFGLGAGAATTVASRSLTLATSGAAGGAGGAGAERVARNAVEGRPLTDGVGTSIAIGGALGAIPLGGGVLDDAAAALRSRPAATTAAALRPELPPAPPPSRGLVHALDPHAPAPAARPRLTSVHAAPPAWLAARFDDTLEAVRRGEGPPADPADVSKFLHETYEHVHEVNALVRALGGRPRELPTSAPTAETLRGVHDFGERASVRRVEELIDDLRRRPIKDADGVPLEVPAWLASLPVEARRRGEATIDVGKLAPYVAAGLGRNGKADPFSIRLHNMSAHHQKLRRGGAALIEELADRVNAMRQVRIYRPKPMPADEIRRILREDLAAGRLPAEAEPLIERAIAAQLRLERSGGVNPYHLLE